MARKFLYVIAGLVVLGIAALFALRIWPMELTRFAFVPSAEFKAQPKLAPQVYDDPKMWLARPALATDPVRWLPQGATPSPKVAAHVFFIHPTSFFARNAWNAPVDDEDAGTLALTFLRGMASPFNGASAVWAPKYRQATFGAFLTDRPETRLALSIAYNDVLQAFDVFARQLPAEGAVVLVGHSQGALHLKQLLKDRIAGTPLARRVAAAYVVGWPVSLAHDIPSMGLPACTRADQAGCILSWLTYAEPADTAATRLAYDNGVALDGQSPKGSAFLCTNPLTGTPGGTVAASANLGTITTDSDLNGGKIVPALVPARCGPEGFLLIGPPREIGPGVLPGNNYHVYDIPLFWGNVRADFARRVAAWQTAR